MIEGFKLYGHINLVFSESELFVYAVTFRASSNICPTLHYELQNTGFSCCHAQLAQNHLSTGWVRVLLCFNNHCNNYYDYYYNLLFIISNEIHFMDSAVILSNIFLLTTTIGACEINSLCGIFYNSLLSPGILHGY